MSIPDKEKQRMSQATSLNGFDASVEGSCLVVGGGRESGRLDKTSQGDCAKDYQ